MWGARKTGKSTFLKEHYPNSIYFDLLKIESYLPIAKDPSIFKEQLLSNSKELLKLPIIIDEVQKIPILLNEIHWLIENMGMSFILCGSSARKLKRGAANLLGGRAWNHYFYPLVYKEIPDFNLLKALNSGLIPSHYLSENYSKSQKAYIENYLKEEIQAEGIVRNLPSFARFLDSISFSHGQLTNFSNIARDCGIDSKTVKEYYQILIDTLLGNFIYPFKERLGRDIITTAPKFYLFDVGIANRLSNKRIEELRGEDAGKSFEHFILMEIIAYKGIMDKDFEINFWRTKSGHEVDFVLDRGKIAVEVKISNQVQKIDLKGLIAFGERNKNSKLYVVSLDKNPRKIIVGNKSTILVLPYKHFLEKLWNGEIL